MRKLQYIIENAQGYITSRYKEFITEKSDENKRQIKNYILKYLEDNEEKIEGYTNDELVDIIYSEMVEYSFLTAYLKNKEIEEINVNSYNDIKITYNNGKIVKSKYNFFNAEHALDVFRRLLHDSNITLDKSNPSVIGNLNQRIRVTAIIPPLVDSNVGISASIRIINPKQFTKDDFINNKTVNEAMLNLLTICHKYGESMCLAGETSSGKTTLLTYILSTIDKNKRLITVEPGTREFNLVKKNSKGKILNNVVHLTANEKTSVKKLLELTLTMNPDYIFMAEMKGDEAYFAQEAARTGHTVTTTIHSKNSFDTYERMATLCKLGHDIELDLLIQLCSKAFPIVGFCRKMNDNTRRLTEITETYYDSEGKKHINPLYRFVITDNDDGKIIGHYEKVGDVSEQMIQRLLLNGINNEELDLITT